VAFVFQAGSDDGNLWLFNLKNGEYFFSSGKEKPIKMIVIERNLAVWNAMKSNERKCNGMEWRTVQGSAVKYIQF